MDLEEYRENTRFEF